jgi:alcohol dehydrogenase YqhD (iron-dependent ADH family)
VRIKGVAQVPGRGQETDIGVLLIWWERDDVMMSVTGGSEADARRFAASLREVDSDDWEHFAAKARPLDDGGGSIATVVTGGSAAMTTTTVP